MTARPIVAMDCETTGLHWGREAWEIALVKRWPDGNVIPSTWLLDVDLKRADPKALELGGFYSRHPAGILLSTGRQANFAVDGAERTAEQIARWTHGAVIVGAQPWFDTHVLSNLLHKHGIPPAWHYRLVCVEALTGGHLGRPLVSLVDSAEALGLDFPLEERHTALGDAQMAMRIWDRLMGGAR